MKNKLTQIVKNNLSHVSLKRGSVLVGIAVLGNICNFLYSAYLGRVLGLEDFALISLISSLLSISQIPLSAFSRTVTHKSAFLLGKYNQPAKGFWRNTRILVRKPTLILTIGWLLLVPLLTSYFKLDSFLPFLLITPLWIVGMTAAVDSGFLSGVLKIKTVAIISLSEFITKILVSALLVSIGAREFVYAAIPISIVVSFTIGWISAVRLPEKKRIIKIPTSKFPMAFYVSSLLTNIATVVFLSGDVILAKHYLDPIAAGQYALLSLVGKMVFFSGTLFTQLVLLFTSIEEGAGRGGSHVFKILISLASLTVLGGFILLGLFGSVTVPLLLGEKAYAITHLLPLYTLAMGCLSIGTGIVSYQQAQQKHGLAFVSFVLSVGAVIGIVFNHSSVAEINKVIVITGIGYLMSVVLLYKYSYLFGVLYNNIIDIFSVFSFKFGKVKRNRDKLNILVFNWRDLRHVWAGGAEVYIHELAKRWVQDGNSVTLFCGNDGKSPRNEVIDGIRIVRRGGFYFVYLWAMIYYILKFRRQYDIVVDSENGVPFFSPLFSTKPIVLLAHHVNQQIFMDHLPFPRAQIAKIVEARIMPFLYRNESWITVSESSKQELIKVGIAKESKIKIVNPGIDIPKTHYKKTKHPSVIYFGRLKPYKNIDVALKAFAKILSTFPTAHFYIAGEGESMSQLKELVRRLDIKKNVTFFGKVNEELKIKLLTQSWLAVQPSQMEGWGITVIEANACGTPVIASNVNGLRDSVVHGKTGVLVELGNISAWSQAMKDIIQNIDLQKTLSKNAYVWSQNFSWNASAQSFYRILKNMATTKGARRVIPRISVSRVNKV